MDLKKINQINPKEITRSFSSLMYRGRKWLALAGILVLMGYCIFIWYFNIYSHYWTEQEKQQYINSTAKDVVYDPRKFDKIINNLASRSEARDKNIEVNNIFIAR
jgi:hypothetical protein